MHPDRNGGVREVNYISQIAAALEELINVGVKVALLTSRNGLMIESAVRNGVSPNLDTAAAGAASTLEAATLMATDLAPSPVREVHVEVEDGSVISLRPIGADAIVVALNATAAVFGRLRLELRRLAPVLAAWLRFEGSTRPAP